MLLADQRLAQIVQRHESLSSEMSNPALEASRFVALSKDYAELTPAADAARKVIAMRREIAELEALAADAAADAEMRALASEELPGLRARLPEAERALALKLLPKDAADAKPAILEIRAGTGGDEAALFAGDLANASGQCVGRGQRIGTGEGAVGYQHRVIGTKADALAQRLLGLWRAHAEHANLAAELVLQAQCLF